MSVLKTSRVAAAILILPCPALVQAAIWHTSVAVPMTVEHDSNPLLLTSQEKAVTSTYLDPEVGLLGTFDRDQFDFGLGAHVLRSSDRNILDDREDPRVRLGWQRDYDKGRYGLVGTYVESSTLSSAVLETGVITTDGTQKLYTLTGNWSRQLSERGLLENETSYDDASYDVSTLIGYKEYANRLSYTYAWTERTDLFTRFIYRRYEPDDRNAAIASNSYTPVIGLTHQFTERLEGSVNVGVNEVSGDGGGRKGQGGVSLRYRGERMDANVAADRSSVASGQGGFSEIDTLRGSWSYLVADTDRVGFDASWQDSKGQTPNKLWSVGAWASRELSPFWVARLSLVYRERQQDNLPDATGTIIGLSLTYRFPDY
ncbi:hypothetical protein [Pseudomonas guariconensis]|uniref:hypothetical protein n=1 Tax=Pseudomonas guariconensis TaxID=1288410 RepID=UPI0018AAEE55|nr:hypothetical protein [Pseudomonas guariconensis]MBF8755977.1 hypothetical protein [Pseudomonas guariconensis]